MDRIDPPEPTDPDDSPTEDPTKVDPAVECTDNPPELKSSVGDYVRELQREYDEQQEEGKIDLADTD